MMKKAFRIFAAFTMLAVYLSMIAGSDIMSLTCSCRNHHHSACCSIGCTHHHDHEHSCDICPIDGFAFSADCACNHDHSTTVELYTQPRSNDDDTSLRNAVLHVIAALLPSDTDCDAPDSSDYSYNEYTLPSVRTILACAISLRAPPALI